MPLNKFMHPRNIYRKPPDFKALAIKYPEFRKYAKQDISGKVRLNFKDLETIRALTSTLLKEDFNLDVEIPLTRLIPTLPLRLNYLLWIEDILKSNEKTSMIRGIDIGCGASCVYPLLAARQFQWHMLATEVDTESAFIASSNVRRNKLENMITVRTVQEGIMLEGVLETNTVYDFCICNPPFFSSEEELNPEHVSRSPKRPLPRNAHSGIMKELVVPGGETAFIMKMIEESKKLKEQIRVYSVMVGHKTSVSKVKEALKEAGVTKVATTEFCQGRTTRWGVAWVFGSDVILPQVKNSPQSHKDAVPFSHYFELDVTDIVMKLHQLMEQLQITYSTLKNTEELCHMEIKAMSNTWVNSRRKRRQEKFKQNESSIIGNKKQKAEDTELCTEKNKDCENDQNKTTTKSDRIIHENTVSKLEENDAELPKNVHEKTTTNNEKDMEKVDFKEVNEPDLYENVGCSKDMNAPKRLKTNDDSHGFKSVKENDPLFYGSLVIKKSSNGSLIELHWLSGSGGKDAAHQVLQYFKNNLKTH